MYRKAAHLSVMPCTYNETVTLNTVSPVNYSVL